MDNIFLTCIFFILAMLGLSLKKGFEDMPFVSESDTKREIVPIKQQTQKQLKNLLKTRTFSQLVELKNYSILM
ncbi:hypothetical protein OENI_250005 [Oenococcus oeni]|nr:hypothetical protein OENI_250005 [Oenococcus oeni]